MNRSQRASSQRRAWAISVPRTASLWRVRSLSSKAWHCLRKHCAFQCPDPWLAQEKGTLLRLECLALLLSTFHSPNVFMSLQEVEMTLEDTISMVLSPYQLLAACFPWLLTYLVACVCVGGGALPSGKRRPPQSLYSSLSFRVWNFSYWLAIFHLWCWVLSKAAKEVFRVTFLDISRLLTFLAGEGLLTKGYTGKMGLPRGAPRSCHVSPVTLLVRYCHGFLPL